MSVRGTPKTDEATQFGQWLSRQRRARDLTQENLAEILGCSVFLVQKMEVGNRRPSKQVAELLADFFGVPSEERAAFIEFARGQGQSRQANEAEGRSRTRSPQAVLRSHIEYGTPNNLPVQLTTFVGRDIELPRVRDLVLRDEVRLLTLTGPPGTGKTRLALEVAAELLRDFEEGVYFVNLAPISDPGLVISEIAQTMGVREGPGMPVPEGLQAYLKTKHLLLVLDNFEHLVEAAPSVAGLLMSAPELKVLATSRVPLHIRGEKEYAVPPLHLPDLEHLPPFERLSWYEGVRLFAERGRDVNADFEITDDNASSVAHVCARLDGLPLAIELAAARVKVLSPQAILAKLESRLELLTGGPRDLPARQRTLRNALEWSYDLLDEEERRLFRRLGVFQGGSSLQAIEAVCWMGGTPEVRILDGASSLVDKGLLRQEVGADGEPRFSMLETIHEYAREKLAEGDESNGGEADAVRRAHALYFMSLAEQAQLHLRDSHQQEWLNRLENEHDNIRAALRWAQDSARGKSAAAGEALEVGLRLGAAVGGFWQVRGYLSEGREKLEALLEVQRAWEARGGDNRREPSARHHRPQVETANEGDVARSERKAYSAAILHWSGMLALGQGDFASARSLYKECLAIQRELGDKRGIAASLNSLGSTAQRQGDLASARSLCEESLAIRRELGDKRGIAASLNNLGALAIAQGNFASGRALHEESLAIRRELGDTQGIAASLNNLGNVALAQGDLASARALHEESLAIKRELGDKRGIAVSLSNLGIVRQEQCDFVSARSLYEESVSIFREIEDRQGIIVSLAGLGGVEVGVATSRGESVTGSEEGATAMLCRATRLLGAVEALLESAGAVLEAENRGPYERAVAEARSRLGEEVFEWAWEKGRTMSMEQALDYALKE